MKRTTIVLVCLILGVASLAPVALATGQSELATARQATAKFHKVSHAERAGYQSTLALLGCFEKPGVGGMGLHYVNFDLVDGVADASRPEALVYEMRDDGKLKLVGLEYLVPAGLVDVENPPSLFGKQFHPHPVLPFWVLHAYIWRPNPSGMFEDFNPSVRMCPEGVPVFGAS